HRYPPVNWSDQPPWTRASPIRRTSAEPSARPLASPRRKRSLGAPGLARVSGPKAAAYLLAARRVTSSVLSGHEGCMGDRPRLGIRLHGGLSPQHCAELAM